MADMYAPHVTLAGSSGVGPIVPGTTAAAIRAALLPVTLGTPVLSVTFGAPHRFMQTNIVSLPLDPHGPLRALHDRIATSGIPFLQARFTFTPHVTLSFFPELDRETTRALMRLRVADAAFFDRLVVSRAAESGKPRVLFELPLVG
jgi:hypothetical protein